MTASPVPDRTRPPSLMERRRARVAAERENLRVSGRRPRDDRVQQQVDHYRPTGKAWVDFDPIEEMTEADLEN
eukprot:4346690-Karenia_brevis.AAC.1